MFRFHVVPGATVNQILQESQDDVIEHVRHAYLLHEDGRTVNPDSYFLRFPARPDARVIALPAYLGGDVDKIGVKWIGSFPANITSGLPRASAVLILNDYATGYPLACLEAAGISAARTAASAALAASALADPAAGTVSFIGAGVIARTILDYLVRAVPHVKEVSVFDLVPDTAALLVAYARDRCAVPARAAESLSDALAADIVVLATTAPSPYVPVDAPLRAGQLILNVSLRDLPPQLLLRANNVVDDVEHCLRAETSPHLAEKLTGGRDFINGTIGAVLRGSVGLRPDAATVFSPFGLGVLDIAVGNHVLRRAISRNDTIVVDDFFGETVRW